MYKQCQHTPEEVTDMITGMGALLKSLPAFSLHDFNPIESSVSKWPGRRLEIVVSGRYVYVCVGTFEITFMRLLNQVTLLLLSHSQTAQCNGATITNQIKS